MANYSTLLADRIAQVLDDKGLTPKQLADMMHKSPSQIWAWLQGKHNFTLATIEGIEEVLGERLIVVVGKNRDLESGESAQDCINGCAEVKVVEKGVSTRKSGTYQRSCPSWENKKAECLRPALTEAQREAKRELPQVQAFQAATQIIRQDFAAPARKALWKFVWEDAKVTVGKSGSYTDSTGRKKVSESLRAFAIKRVLQGKGLVLYFADLQTVAADEVLAQEIARRDAIREERNRKKRGERRK